MRKHFTYGLYGLGAATLALVVTTGSAFAQGVPVGTPGEPNCHGERVSAGNQRVEDIVIPELGIDLTDYRLTPPNRTNLLNTFGVDGRTDWTVQDFQNRVRASCDSPGQTGG
jgi:hypothetical protein